MSVGQGIVDARERREVLQRFIVVTVFRTVIFGALAVLALVLEFRLDGEHFQTYLLLCVCGWAAGWFTALLITPFTPSEASIAAKIFDFIATFVSGYLFGVVSRLVQSATRFSHASK